MEVLILLRAACSKIGRSYALQVAAVLAGMTSTLSGPAHKGDPLRIALSHSGLPVPSRFKAKNGADTCL